MAELPRHSGVACGNGADAVLEASTVELLAWLQAKHLPEPRLREVERLDTGLRGFRRTVLRYGLVKALIDKGHDVPRDAAAWAVFDAAMRARLQRRPA